MIREYKHIGLQMKTLRHIIILLTLLATLLGTMPLALAQTRVNWSGNVNGQTISSDTQVTLTGDVYLSGPIKVEKYKTLTITTNGNYTIHRSGFNGWMFCETAYHVDNRCNITMDGGDYTITIDGGAVYNEANNALSGFKNGTPSNYGRPIWCSGHLILNKVTVQNCYHPNETGFIDLENMSPTSSYVCKITNCTIQGNYGGSVFYMEGQDWHRATLQNVTFQYNDATQGGGEDHYGACIRANGATRSRLYIKDCSLHHNKVEGGAIHWNAGGQYVSDNATQLAECHIYGNTEIAYNTSINNNGGIYNCAIMNLSSAFIHHNHATNDGGGIRMTPYNGGMSSYSGEGYSLIVTDSVRICNNSAGRMGGGVFLSIEATNDIAFNPSGNQIDAHFSVNIQGGEISGNHAPKGGGICIQDTAPYTYSVSNKQSGAYLRNVNIQAGRIFGNYTDAGNNTGDSDNEYGGAICIEKYDPGNVTNTTYFGILTVNISGGEIFQNSAFNGTGTDANTGCGGAFYIRNTFPSGKTSGCDVIVSGTTQVYGNSSEKHGAGIYLDGGSFTLAGGTVGKDGTTQVPGSSPAEYKTNHNEASQDGGGFYVNGGLCTVKGGTISYNDASIDGGGFYVNGGTCTVRGGTISHNNASDDGGGFYVHGGACAIHGGTIEYNNATGNGGGFYVNPGTGSLTEINDYTATTNINNNTAVDGGGAYVASGTLRVAKTGTNIHHNTASSQGGGLYVNSTGSDGTVINSGASVNNNIAGSGGGLYVNNGNVDVNVDVNDLADFETQNLYQMAFTNDTVFPWFVTKDNYCNSYSMKSGNGDVLLQSKYENYASSGTLRYSHSSISTSAYFEQAGTIMFKARIRSEASFDKGYFFIDGSVQSNLDGINGAGNWIDYSYNVSAGYHTFTWRFSKDYKDNGNGDAFYVDDIRISYALSNTAVSIINNESTMGSGGGLYAAGGNVNLNSADISSNQAATDGGGIYAEGGIVTVNNSTVNDNFAAEKGGGLYIPSTGMLNLTGTTTLAGNHVPYGKLGGGVYLLGTVQAGNSSSDAINVSTNYAGNSYVYVQDGANTRNNIYLPNPNHTSTIPDTWPDVITVVNDGLNLNSSRIGFSVPHNFVPVIYCKTANYLSPTIMSSDAIFEDSGRYTKYYANNPSAGYYPNFIYLSADTWVQAVTSQPSGFSASNIDSEEDLAWVISMVNGLNGVTAAQAATNAQLTYTLTADLDMKAHSWVPIGLNATDEPKTFQGTFNGHGHTISNIYCSYLGDSHDSGTGRGLGMFGTTDGATIHDVFLHGVELDVHNQTGNDAYVMGAIANEAKGNTIIYNCIAHATMESSMANTTMGGLVGKLTNGTIHSSAAMPDMTGYTMGGLVGNNSGNIYNSFAHAKFHSSGSGYVGGLVAVNTGTIENCYAREQSDSSHGGSFGWLAGANQVTENNSTTKGNLNYCYAPDNTYTASGVGGNQTGLSTFTPTSTPYLYKHADNQVVEVSGHPYITNGVLDRNGLKGLLATLNKWVGNSNTYSKWMRTCASSINDDYPIHNYSNYVCVGSKDNILLEYDADFNAKFGEYISADLGTIYLYKSPLADVTSSLSNSGKATELYIHEDVVIMHASAIKAHVGITLDNSAGAGGAPPSFGGSDAIDWHFFSSALADAPIGLVYGDGNQYLAYHYPDWQAYFNNEDGYFPTNFNTSTPSSSDYYADWDLYSYYEPDYHWINLKRNSASHWHEDYPDTHISSASHVTEFEPGRGFMVALKDEGYLQGYGTLNTHQSSTPLEVNLSYTPSISWTTRQGHNLLGNPYQSYLDFDAFAAANTGIWNGGLANASYIIIDENQKDYVLYTYNASENSFGADRYLHPHQGFMVVTGKANLTAKFHDGMRSITGSASFRSGDRPNYPLVNLFATDDNGNRDMVTVELGRPDKGGALKQDAWRTGKGSLWCRYEDEDYALVFTQPGLEYANIRFACDEDGEYTMTWNTQNGEFSYLHLIDNITGTDIDCLSKSEYRFTAQASDYNSRFRLMFGYTGIEAPEAPDPVEGPATFAYYANGEIHLVETQNFASLQIIDMTGRTVVSRDAVPASATLSTNGMAAGVYVLRLITENGTRTQKIILD